MNQPATKDDLLRHEKIMAQIDESMALTAKLKAETDKINKENQYYIAIVTATVVLALVAVVKIFL